MDYYLNCRKQIRSILLSAIECFNQKEKYLIENDLSERCICAKFSFYLTEAIQGTDFSDYNVDVEYNRGFDGQDRAIKRIENAPITVDLIVHKRGYNSIQGYNNLICIEMKKSTNRQGCNNDEDRLKKMVGWEYGYCYGAGFMIVINMKEKRLEIKNEFPIIDRSEV